MKDKWNELSMYERNEFIKTAVKNGLRDPLQIRDKYNEYAEGGDLDNDNDSVMDLSTKYPTVTYKEEPWAEEFFNNNPHVAGMAIGEGENGIDGPRRVIVNEANPYMQDPNSREGLLKLERARHWMSETDFDMPITRRQRRYYDKKKFEGTYRGTDDKTKVRTDVSRYLVGDTNKLNRKQRKYIDEATKNIKFANGGDLDKEELPEQNLQEVEVVGHDDLFNRERTYEPAKNVLFGELTDNDLDINNFQRIRRVVDENAKVFEEGYGNAQNYLNDWYSKRAKDSDLYFDKKSQWFGTKKGYNFFDKLFKTKRYKDVRNEFSDRYNNVADFYNSWSASRANSVYGYPSKYWEKSLSNYESLHGYKYPYSLELYNKLKLLGELSGYDFTSPTGIDDSLQAIPAQGLYTRKNNAIFILSNLKRDSDAILHETAHSKYTTATYNPISRKIRKIIGDNYNKDALTNSREGAEYWNDPNEVNSRLMEFRAMNNINPEHKVTLLDILKLRSGINSGTYKDAYLFNLYDDDLLVSLFNNVYANGGYKEPKHWKALQSVPHHVVADPNWNNNIETFVPNNVKRIWPNITDEELSKGYYKNNPYPGENTILYNPNDKTVDANTIALDGLHFMHDNPTYEDFYSDLVTSMRRDPELVFTSLMDQTGDDALSRNITTKFIKGKSLTSEDKEYLLPAIDGYLRRQFAPDYMRGVRGGYDTAYKGDKSILNKTKAIRDLMESFILPEVTVTAPKKKANGGGLDLLPKPFSYTRVPSVRYDDGGFLGWLSSLFGSSEESSSKPSNATRPNKRVRHNDSPTAGLSEIWENKMHLLLIENPNNKAEYRTHTPEYDIPYIKEKEIKIPGIGRTTTNALDSIAKYAELENVPIDEAIALSAYETKLGAIPLFNFLKGNEAFNRILGNTSYFRNFGTIPAEYIVRDFEYNKGGYNNGNPIIELPPLQHALRHYKQGRYNPALKDHTKNVRALIPVLKASNEYLTWKKKRK